MDPVLWTERIIFFHAFGKHSWIKIKALNRKFEQTISTLRESIVLLKRRKKMQFPFDLKIYMKQIKEK